jgi:hypothetical protein
MDEHMINHLKHLMREPNIGVVYGTPIDRIGVVQCPHYTHAPRLDPTHLHHQPLRSGPGSSADMFVNIQSFQAVKVNYVTIAQFTR